MSNSASGVCSWLSLRKCPMSWLRASSLALIAGRRQSSTAIISSRGKNSSGRSPSPAARPCNADVHGSVLICRSSSRGAVLSQLKSSGLLLGIQNICSSSVSLSARAVSCSCFWFSCRVIEALSRASSSRLRRSSSSLRVVARSSSVLRSSGVTSLSACWASS